MPKWLRLTASFSGLVIAPIAVEFLISYIKTEPYNLVRAAQVLIAVGGYTFADSRCSILVSPTSPCSRAWPARTRLGFNV